MGNTYMDFILLFNFLIILLHFSAALHLLWNREILPKFLKKYFLIYLYCILVSLIASLINNYVTITGIVSVNISVLIKLAMIFFMSSVLIVPLMEIIFYFLYSSISTIKSKMLFIVFMVAILMLFIIPIPHFLYKYIVILFPILSAISIVFLRKRFSDLKKLDDPGILLIFKVLLFTIGLIPLEIIELLLLKSGHNMLILGQLSIYSLAIISSLTILKTINKSTRDTKNQPVLNDKFISEYQITPRESEILLILLNGKSHREIGETLNISPRTVDSHVLNIYKKCKVKSWKELFALLNR